MLRITIRAGEYWNETTQEFGYSDGITVLLEHSLLSVAKWEARWKKPFLTKTEKSRIEMTDYVRCMAVDKGVDSTVFKNLSEENYQMIEKYINDPMTATTFYEHGSIKPHSRRVITAEVIYCWMTMLNIPFSCETWHLNRLLTLIRVCNIENAPKKKQKTGEIIAQNKALNQQRRKQLGTTG